MFLLTSVVRPLRQQPSHSHPRSAIGSASPSPPASDADKNEICLFFIRRHCSFKGRTSSIHRAFRAGCVILSEHSFVSDCPSLFEESLGIIFLPEKCARVHWHLPYRWQVFDNNGATWKDLPCMENVEQAYCKPENDSNGSKAMSPIQGLFKFLSIQR